MKSSGWRPSKLDLGEGRTHPAPAAGDGVPATPSDVAPAPPCDVAPPPGLQWSPRRRGTGGPDGLPESQPAVLAASRAQRHHGDATAELSPEVWAVLDWLPHRLRAGWGRGIRAEGLPTAPLPCCDLQSLTATLWCLSVMCTITEKTVIIITSSIALMFYSQKYEICRFLRDKAILV